MKKIIILMFLILFYSCNKGIQPISYSEITVEQFNNLKSPVILFSKSRSLGQIGVCLIDGDGKLHYFGNMSSLANGIGRYYKIGDTLK